MTTASSVFKFNFAQFGDSKDNLMNHVSPIL